MFMDNEKMGWIVSISIVMIIGLGFGSIMLAFVTAVVTVILRLIVANR